MNAWILTKGIHTDSMITLGIWQYWDLLPRTAWGASIQVLTRKTVNTQWGFLPLCARTHRPCVAGQRSGSFNAPAFLIPSSSTFINKKQSTLLAWSPKNGSRRGWGGMFPAGLWFKAKTFPKLTFGAGTVIQSESKQPCSPHLSFSDTPYNTSLYYVSILVDPDTLILNGSIVLKRIKCLAA